MTSLTSRKSHARTLGLFSVSTKLEASVSHVSHGESKDSMHRPRQREKKEREREKKEKVLWSVLQSRCQREVDWNRIKSHSPQTHRDFYSDERDLREDLERRAQQAVHCEKFSSEKLYLTEYDLEIQNLERRNSECALNESRRELESRRRQLLEANQWADQSQRERIHLCSELETKNRLHQQCHTRNCQEIEELRRRCYKEQKWSNSTKVE